MIKLIWQKLKLSEKIGLGVIALLLIYITYQAGVIAYRDHQLLKRVSEDIETVKTEISENETDTKTTIDKGKKNNQKAIDKSKAIDEKLKSDEKTIDNTDYSDSKLDSLLTSYGN